MVEAKTAYIPLRQSAIARRATAGAPILLRQGYVGLTSKGEWDGLRGVKGPLGGRGGAA